MRGRRIPGDPGVKLLNEAQALRARPGNQRLTALPKEAAEVGLWMAELESLINGSAFRFVANPRAACAMLSVPGPPTSSILWTCSASPIEDGGTQVLSDVSQRSTERTLNHYAKTPGSVARKSAYRQFPPSGSTF
jgi:hypothetical protein